MGRRAHKPIDAWKFVDKRGPKECWPWIGSVKRYGVFSMKHETFRAHRVIYFLTHPGEISLKIQDRFSDDADIVLHTCDNPACCNPNHLVLGTPKDNTQDMISKGRRFNNKGELHPLSKLSNEEVREIRELAAKKIPLKEIAKKYGVSVPTVSGIKWRRVYWSVG